MPAKPIPEFYHALTPQLAIDGADKAIEFYKRAFGAEVVDRAADPSGKQVWHCSMRVGDSMLFVNDVFPEMGGTPSQSSMWLYVEDCDAAFKRATDAGAKAAMPPADMFWGDRMGQVVDPFGQKWTIATHVKDMTPAEVEAAKAAFLAQASQK
jgi:uncharacterized glyoxalase superfamily protein PhnB